MRLNVVNINETKVISVFLFLFFKVTACLREFAPTSYVITKDPRRDGVTAGLRLLKADGRKRLMSMRYADAGDFSTPPLPYPI